MAIINSITIGNSRKSIGNVTLYRRRGLTIARQKPSSNVDRVTTNAQRRVRYYFGQLVRAMRMAGVTRFVRMFSDAQPEKGKSQTGINRAMKNAWKAWYSYAPDHLPVISGGATPSQTTLVPLLMESGIGQIVYGKLGSFPGGFANVGNNHIGLYVSEALLNQMLFAANTNIRTGEDEYTIENCYVALLGQSGAMDSQTIMVDGIKASTLVKTPEEVGSGNAVNIQSDYELAENTSIFVVAYVQRSNDDGTPNDDYKSMSTDSIQTMTKVNQDDRPGELSLSNPGVAETCECQTATRKKTKKDCQNVAD